MAYRSPAAGFVERWTDLNGQHVAAVDFEQFYQPAFPDAAAAQAFVSCVERIPAEQSKAKIVLHQAARMLWLADRIEEVARGRPALFILFYLIAAEAVAKLVVRYQGEGESRRHVRLFFEDICSARHRGILANAFTTGVGTAALTVRETVDLLYDVRCDVVHEGQYFTFTLPEPTDRFQMITEYGGAVLMPSIRALDLRQVVLEGAVLGAARLLAPDSPCVRYVPAL